MRWRTEGQTWGTEELIGGVNGVRTGGQTNGFQSRIKSVEEKELMEWGGGKINVLKRWEN